MPDFRSISFCLSAPQHGLQTPEGGLPLGQQQQLTHLLHLPALSTVQQRGSTAAAAALPSRYYTTNPGFLFPERSEVPKQAFGFSPVFHLSHCCSSTSSRVSSAAILSHESVIALRPSTDLVRVPTPSAALLVLQQQRQRELCQPEQQQRQKRKQKEAGALLQQASGSPWLGAQLDVGGYTKRGFISGGGKDQNQDRGLILEEFRSPNEILLGVMDGHGTSGHLVSTYLAQHLPAVLMQKLVAAAATINSSSNGSNAGQHKQRRLFGKSSKQQQQQQQQKQGPADPDQDLQFTVSQVPYVVVPDHWPKYGFSPVSEAASDYSISTGKAGNQPGHVTGRAVSKQQLVQQQLHSHPLDDLDSSSSSSSSYGLSSSQKWLHPVPHQAVRQVALSEEVLTGAFTATDFYLSGSGINVVDSGSTALLCHIGPRSITTAWVGDSRAVLGRRKQLLQTRPKQQLQQQQGQGPLQLQPQQQPAPSSWEAIPLSVDHKPERNDEYLRISRNEGRVAQIMGRGPYRVWFKGIDYPGLAMSRAFGDSPCRRIGVTVEPEVTVHPLTPGDELLIAATDGIWDVLSNDEVVTLAGNSTGAQAAARTLVEVAESRWLESEGGYIDDITAVVVRATPAAGAASSA